MVSKSYLNQEDRQRLEASTSWLIESESEAGVPEREDTKEEDLPIGNQSNDDDLSTLIGGVAIRTRVTTQMDTTTTMAYARGGGAVILPSENPLQPLVAVAQAIQQIRRSAARPLRQPSGYQPPIGGGGGPPAGGSGEPPARGGGGPPAGGGGPSAGGDGRSPAGGGEPPAGGNQPAAQPAGATIPTARHLGGHVKLFEGDQSKFNKFEAEFGLYRLLNVNHPLVAVPMQWVALALSYIRGEKVQQFTCMQGDLLAARVYGVGGHPPLYQPMDKELWNKFTVNF
jgi:hypothetical protein